MIATGNHATLMRQIMKFIWHTMLFLSIFILAACGSVEAPPTPRPSTQSPTPISTELPVVATAIPAGFSDDNPIQIVIVPVEPQTASAGLAEFESALQELTDVTIRVVLAETQTEAAGLVCASESGIISAAWLDGMSAITNQLAGCGITSLQAETENGTGQTGVLLLNTEFQDDGLESALESPLCRIAVDDLFSWTLPVLFYGNEGFTVPEILEINELADNDAIIADLMDGDCVVAGMSETAWEVYLDADEDGSLDENVFIVATSPEIPYNAFSFSGALSLDAVTDIESALLQIDVDADLMEAFFGEVELQSLDSSDFAEVIEFFQASGINFSEFRS